MATKNRKPAPKPAARLKDLGAKKNPKAGISWSGSDGEDAKVSGRTHKPF